MSYYPSPTAVDNRHYPREFNTSELHEILNSLGFDFEEEYTRHNTGEQTHNQLLGITKQGIIDWAESQNWIAKRIINDDQVYWVFTQNGTDYVWWPRLYWAMKELQARREYAQKCEKKIPSPNEKEIDSSKIPF